jgi:hypothetical protein
MAKRYEDVGSLRRELAAAKWRERALRKQLAAAESAADSAQAELASFQTAQPYECRCNQIGCRNTFMVVPEPQMCWSCSLQDVARVA